MKILNLGYIKVPLDFSTLQIGLFMLHQLTLRCCKHQSFFPLKVSVLQAVCHGCPVHHCLSPTETKMLLNYISEFEFEHYCIVQFDYPAPGPPSPALCVTLSGSGTHGSRSRTGAATRHQHYSGLQPTALRCLQHYSVMYSSVLRCTVLQCSALHCYEH